MRTSAASVFLVLLGCASTPLPSPSSEAACVVGVQIRVEDPVRLTTAAPKGVYFVRFDEGGNPLRQKEVLESTVREGNTFLLFDAAPGRYAVVGSFEWRDGKRFYTVFSEDCIRDSVADAAPGALAFLGRGRIRSSTRTSRADRAQGHYCGVMIPGFAGAGGLKQIFGRDKPLIGRQHTWHRDDETEAAFVDVARGVLRRTAWADRLP